MTAWWYVDKDKKIGPIETDELKRLLQSGKVGANTRKPGTLPLFTFAI